MSIVHKNQSFRYLKQEIALAIPEIEGQGLTTLENHIYNRCQFSISSWTICNSNFIFFSFT